MVNIRHLNPTDASANRNLRLEALKINPEAFASSYEEEKDRLIEFFKKRLQSCFEIMEKSQGQSI